MKNRVIIFLLPLLTVFACKDDSSNLEFDNYFAFNGNTYEIKTVITSDQYYENGKASAIAISFIDQFADAELENNEIIANEDDIIGMNSAVIANGYSYDGNLQSGEYEISDSSDFECSVGISYTGDDQYLNEYEITNGVLSISISDVIYTIEIYGTDDNGNTFELKYEGIPEYYKLVY